MNDFIQGAFHFHSTYSHDGRSPLVEIAETLSARGLTFCVMTEHFEDLDAGSFNRYVLEVEEVNRAFEQFVLIPGVEVNISGIDTILFPAKAYEAIAGFAAGRTDGRGSLFSVVAHPSKYPIDKLMAHLDRYAIDGIELWNQQTDGRHMPPPCVLSALRLHPRRNEYRYFFGCDVHDARLTVTNVISCRRPAVLTTSAILACLTTGAFISRSLVTGIEYSNALAVSDFDGWVATLGERSFYRAHAFKAVRRLLKSAYTMLPSPTRHSLNDFKNLVRNKL